MELAYIVALYDKNMVRLLKGLLTVHWLSLASPTHFCKEGNGLVNCIYKPCPTALYSAVQSHCSILSHDGLCHCLSCNSSLENGKREL